MENPKPTIAARLADLERRATLAEDVAKALEKRIRILEKQSGIEEIVAEKKEFDYENPPLRNHLIFAPKKSNKTLFIDYYWLDPLETTKVRLEQILKEAGFIIINNRKEASEIAFMIGMSTDRPGSQRQIFSYLEQNLNAFIILWQPQLYASKMVKSIKVIDKSEMQVPIYPFQCTDNKNLPIGFVGKIPSPRFASKINYQICLTCGSDSRFKNSNVCNVCDQSFCGMECFTRGHRDCYTK